VLAGVDHAMGVAMDTWAMIRSERSALVDALASVPPAAWDTPSLCTGWSVRDVIAHMVATASMTPPRFVAKFAGSGFNLPAMTRKDINQLTARYTDVQLLDRFRQRVDARTAPPGPALSWLGETVVHGEDVFRALGGYRDHPVEHVVAVADFYKNSDLLIGSKRRISGVLLEATDTAWRHGSGPGVRGPVTALVMAMTGRKAALGDLSGDGVAILDSRS
jgi:uncharacterized protein (TIGR03083 family)